MCRIRRGVHRRSYRYRPHGHLRVERSNYGAYPTTGQSHGNPVLMPHKAISVMAKGDVANWELHRIFQWRSGADRSKSTSDQGGSGGICGSTHFAHSPSCADVIYSPASSQTRERRPASRCRSWPELPNASQHWGHRYLVAPIRGSAPTVPFAFSSQTVQDRYANRPVSRFVGPPGYLREPSCGHGPPIYASPNIMTSHVKRANRRADLLVITGYVAGGRVRHERTVAGSGWPVVDRKRSRSRVFRMGSRECGAYGRRPP
jgi:hypothetical protein